MLEGTRELRTGSGRFGGLPELFSRERKKKGDGKKTQSCKKEKGKRLLKKIPLDTRIEPLSSQENKVGGGTTFWGEKKKKDVDGKDKLPERECKAVNEKGHPKAHRRRGMQGKTRGIV